MVRFNPTKEMRDAAMAVLIAMAHEKAIRPIVEAYQNAIMKERTWPVQEKYRDLDGQFVTDPKHSYLMTDEDFAVFHKRCLEEGIAANLHVEEEGQCPLLVARRDLSKATFALAKVMEPITKIEEDQLRGSDQKMTEEFLQLTLRLFAPYMEEMKVDESTHLDLMYELIPILDSATQATSYKIKVGDEVLTTSQGGDCIYGSELQARHSARMYLRGYCIGASQKARF